MGKALGAVIGVVEIVAGVAGWGPTAGFDSGLIVSGIGSLIGYGVSLLLNPGRPPLLQIGANYTGTLEPAAHPPETLEELAAVYLE